MRYHKLLKQKWLLCKVKQMTQYWRCMFWILNYLGSCGNTAINAKCGSSKKAFLKDRWQWLSWAMTDYWSPLFLSIFLSFFFFFSSFGTLTPDSCKILLSFNSLKDIIFTNTFENLLYLLHTREHLWIHTYFITLIIAYTLITIW